MDKLKILLLESKYPYFSDTELLLFLDENNGDVYRTASELCYLKADGDTSVTVGPIKIEGAGADFWIKLAEKYSSKADKLQKANDPNYVSGYKTQMERG